MMQRRCFRCQKLTFLLILGGHFQRIHSVAAADNAFYSRALSDNVDLAETMQWHIDHAMEVTRRLQSSSESICDFYESFIDKVPDGRDNCKCAQDTITCSYSMICQQNICAESVKMTMKMESTLANSTNLIVTTCSQQVGFEKTCLNVIVDEKQKLVQCTDATYGDFNSGGGGCQCSACPGTMSVSLDCSEHDPAAVTSGCIHVDTTNLTGAIPYYGSTLEYDNDKLQPLSSIKNTSWPQTAVNMILAQNRCDNFGLLDDLLSTDARKNCGCDDTVVSCQYGAVCSENGVCAASVDISMDFSDGLLVSSCANYTESFQEMCFDLMIASDRNSSKCKGTYGGAECVCEVCQNGGRGVKLDCSEYHPLAVTNGCQEVAAVEMFTDVQGPCGDLQYAVQKIPENTATCECADGSVTCEFGEICRKDDGVCAAPVEMTFVFEGMRSVKSCSNFTTGEFEKTCVEISIGSDRLLDTCTSASYGGLPCSCKVCEDRASVNVDCSAYKPLASTGGCQNVHLMNLTSMELRPFVPEFRIDALQIIGTHEEAHGGSSADSFEANRQQARFIMISALFLTFLLQG